MNNDVVCVCKACGASTRHAIPEDGSESDIVRCTACGNSLATVGQLHATIAQQALGIGATELRDDHVPVDGALGEQPGR